MNWGFPKPFACSENPGIEPGLHRPPAWACRREQGMGPLGPPQSSQIVRSARVCMGRPCILSESPSPGVSDPLLPPPAAPPRRPCPHELRRLCSHPRPRSTLDPLWLQKLDLLVDSDSGLHTQVPGDLCPPPARWPWQGNPQPSPGVPGVLIYQAHLQALVGMR